MPSINSAPKPAHPDEGFSRFIGASPARDRIVRMASRVAPTSGDVLLEGETGTGKELLAELIHVNSARSQRNFVAVNCAAIPRDLLESELFGYRRGAFTGAVTDFAGRLERADGGTLLLDEIGDLPLDLQAKLLRLVQQREVEPLGAARTRKLDLRIIAATNRPLKALVESGGFRPDLYYRLAVVVLHLPRLEDRREDIPALVDHFFALYARRHQRSGLRLPSAVRDLFLAPYAWPGNVRELAHAVERAVLLAAGDEVRPEDLPETLVPSERPPRSILLPPPGVALPDVEREMLRRALESASGNRAKAARSLGITRKSLVCRLRKHGLGASFARNGGRSKD